MTVEQNILCGIRAGSRSEKRSLAAEELRMFRLEGLEKSIPRSSPAGSSSASRSPASSAPSRRRSCSTSPSPRSTATSSGTRAGALRPARGLSRPDPLGQPRPRGMLPQLSKGLRDGKRRFSLRDGHGDAGAPSATQSAAQLTGCRNFLPVRRCGAASALTAGTFFCRCTPWASAPPSPFPTARSPWRAGPYGARQPCHP